MLTPCITTSHYQSQELQFTLEPTAIILSCLQINNDLHIPEPKSQLSELILCYPSSLLHRVGNSLHPTHFFPLDSRSCPSHFPSLVLLSTFASSWCSSLVSRYFFDLLTSECPRVYSLKDFFSLYCPDFPGLPWFLRW